MTELDPEPMPVHELAVRIVAGERRALAKAVTLVESTRSDHAEQAQALLALLAPRAGGSVRVAISGVPGVGKSTFIDALGTLLISLGKKVAVLAIDPSSVISGGSILGDKTRMPRLALSDQAFVRPSPAGGSLGGVARRTREALLLCEAAGFDVILVETVGVGQSEFAAAEMVDVFLLLMLAGAGDDLQGIKRGILEVADLVAITKADGSNRERAENARLQYEQALRLLRGSAGDGSPEVVTSSALEDRGVEPVWRAIEAKYRALQDTGMLERKRAAQRGVWLKNVLEHSLQQRFFAHPSVVRQLPEITSSVERSDITPEEGARRLLALFDSET